MRVSDYELLPCRNFLFVTNEIKLYMQQYPFIFKHLSSCGKF